MSRRTLPSRKPGPEPAAGGPVARHRLSAGPGGPETTGHGTRLPEALAPEGPAGAHPREPGPAASGARSRTGWRAVALLGVTAAVLGGWFWWQAAAGAPEVFPLSEVSPAAVPLQANSPRAGSSTGQAGAGTEPARITVHVAGAVVHPGVVELPAGSRLHEALTAAGGPTGAADPDRLNLAAVLEDGQKILVSERGQPDAAAGSSDSGSAEAGGAGTGGAGTGGAGPAGTGPGGASGGNRINLNTAGVEELGTLPRVGPVLAQRIVDWRKQHGRFQTVDELDAVEGVGPKLLETLLPLVRV